MNPSKDLPHGRYTKGRSLIGDLTFTILRTLDVPIQWYILHRFSSPTSRTFLQLSPYNTILVGITLTNAARQIFWKLYTGEQIFTASLAIGVSIFNTVNNGLNIAMALWGGALMSNAPKAGEGLFESPTRVLGLGLFVVGSLVETGAELGRKAFKDESRNKGKIYTGGLFGLARHVNFAGYLLWRAGFAMFSGGLIWGAVIAEIFILYFTKAGIPPLADYMQERYGAAWKEYTKRVPYRLIPGIL